MDIQNLKRLHLEKREEIKNKLEAFKQFQQAGNKEIFPELCFCILTPQSKAFNCWNAVLELQKKNLLYDGKHAQIKKILQKKVRFHNNKAKYIVKNRKLLENGLKDKIIKGKNNQEIREWLTENIQGFGYKEASHFLRNIGFRDLAILDRHILKNLVDSDVIDKIPKNLNKKNYLEIEKKFQEYSQKIGIPMDELDLLFWSLQTGKVFK